MATADPQPGDAMDLGAVLARMQDQLDDLAAAVEAQQRTIDEQQRVIEELTRRVDGGTRRNAGDR
jgi:uncharacterized coiled-coil protein SlyX